MAGFSLNDILGGQSVAAQDNSPAGLNIAMLDIESIHPNPKNEIYEIGDVELLKADIAEKGLRSPLEVIEDAEEGSYTLIAGHRRWTALNQLVEDDKDFRFMKVPCVVRESAGEDEDLISLITSNATARELTDGEKLRQFAALDAALKRQKAAGKITGRVREAMVKITGDGNGTLARYAAIVNNCVPEVIDMVGKGECSITRAYEASKLYKVQQVEYAKHGYAPMPRLDPADMEKAINWIVRVMFKGYLQGLDYIEKSQWNFTNGAMPWDHFRQDPAVLTATAGGWLYIVQSDENRKIAVSLYDSLDEKHKPVGEPIAAETIGIHNEKIYRLAKNLYINKDKLAEQKLAAKEVKAEERERQQKANEKVAFAQHELETFGAWDKVGEVKALGLEMREYPLKDGGRLVLEVDLQSEDKSYKPGSGFMYHCVRALRFDADGNRVKMSTGLPSVWRPEMQDGWSENGYYGAREVICGEYEG